MPSDCQCSSSHTEVRDVIKVINNKQASERIKRLENEVKELNDKVMILKSKICTKTISKKKMILELKSQLDRM